MTAEFIIFIFLLHQCHLQVRTREAPFSKWPLPERKKAVDEYKKIEKQHWAERY